MLCNCVCLKEALGTLESQGCSYVWPTSIAAEWPHRQQAKGLS
jgi:hypothetical protein